MIGSGDGRAASRAKYTVKVKKNLLTNCVQAHDNSLEVQPIPLGVTFSKAQSSKLERLFCHVSVKRDV